MNFDNIMTKRGRACLGIAVLLFATVQGFAHGGFDHVKGTVVKVNHNVLTVKTTKGNIDVKLNDKSNLTKNDRQAALADLMPGARVIVDILEGSKDNLAHSVKIGVVSKTAAPMVKDSHK